LVSSHDAALSKPQNNRQQPWIHDAVVRQEKIFQPVSHSEGHMLIIGTMGSGKTRCFDLLIFRTFLRNGLHHWLEKWPGSARRQHDALGFR
jgi:type IV conjugative transfer system protein traD